MIIHLNAEKLQQALEHMIADGDAEKLSDEYAADFYDTTPPASMEIQLVKGQCHVLSAYYLLFSDELSGWYTGDRMEDPAQVAAVLSQAIPQE